MLATHPLINSILALAISGVLLKTLTPLAFIDLTVILPHGGQCLNHESLNRELQKHLYL